MMSQWVTARGWYCAGGGDEDVPCRKLCSWKLHSGGVWKFASALRWRRGVGSAEHDPPPAGAICRSPPLLPAMVHLRVGFAIGPYRRRSLLLPLDTIPAATTAHGPHHALYLPSLKHRHLLLTQSSLQRLLHAIIHREIFLFYWIITIIILESAMIRSCAMITRA